jgi:hypothetical protein
VKRWFWKEIVGIDAGDDFHSNDADADSWYAAAEDALVALARDAEAETTTAPRNFILVIIF